MGETVERIRQTVFRGIVRVDQQFKLTMTASPAGPHGAKPRAAVTAIQPRPGCAGPYSFMPASQRASRRSGRDGAETHG